MSVCSIKGTPNHHSSEQWLRENFRWDDLTALCNRHRLLPVFYNNLKDFSNFSAVDIPLLLKENFASQTQNTLKLTVEGIRMSGIISNENVPVIMLKGPFLSELLYSNATLRPSRDIDILVQPENVEIVNDILLNEGYNKVYPDFELTKKQKKFYETTKNQYAYRNQNNGCLLELHWRLFSTKPLLSITSEELFKDSIEIKMADRSIRVLSKNHLIQHLSLHGSIHQWFRLLWLRDIAQLVSGEKENLEEILKHSRELGTERAVEQAIRLSNMFFDGTSLSLAGNPKRVTNSLINQATTAIVEDESKSLSRKLSRLRLPFYKMKIRKELKYKISCWTILHPNFEDWRTFKFPDKLFFLYFLLRPFLWFYTVYLRKTKVKKPQ